jgi:hypothetical protein
MRNFFVECGTFVRILKAQFALFQADRDALKLDNTQEILAGVILEMPSTRWDHPGQYEVVSTEGNQEVS